MFRGSGQCNVHDVSGRLVAIARKWGDEVDVDEAVAWMLLNKPPCFDSNWSLVSGTVPEKNPLDRPWRFSKLPPGVRPP